MTSGERAVAGGRATRSWGASVRSGGADAGRGRTVQGAVLCSSPAPEVYKRHRPTSPNGFNLRQRSCGAPLAVLFDPAPPTWGFHSNALVLLV